MLIRPVSGSGALAADFTGFLAAAWTVRLFFGP